MYQRRAEDEKREREYTRDAWQKIWEYVKNKLKVIYQASEIFKGFRCTKIPENLKDGNYMKCFELFF